MKKNGSETMLNLNRITSNGDRKESFDWALSLVRSFQDANDCDWNFLSKHPFIVQAFLKT